jgi:putative lipoic acid-binding regulatory protein
VTPGDGGGPPGSGFAYPLEYTFKILGLAADDFPEHARRLVARAVAEVPAERVTVRASGAGKYLSVSVTALLQSEAERLAVYEVLRSDPRVVFAL